MRIVFTSEELKRIDNWLRAQKECPKAIKGATRIICDHLKLLKQSPSDTDTEEQATVSRANPADRIDTKDATKLDNAYSKLPYVLSVLIRMYHFENRHPKHIERVLHLPSRTFRKHHAVALRELLKIADTAGDL